MSNILGSVEKYFTPTSMLLFDGPLLDDTKLDSMKLSITSTVPSIDKTAIVMARCLTNQEETVNSHQSQIVLVRLLRLDAKTWIKDR